MTDVQTSIDNLNEREALRREMGMFNWMIFICTWAILLFLAYLHEDIVTSPAARHTSLALGVAWIYSMSRFDYLIHRVGAFLRPTSSWEQSEVRNKDLQVLILADVGSSFPILWFWGSALVESFTKAPNQLQVGVYGLVLGFAVLGVYNLIKAAQVR